MADDFQSIQDLLQQTQREAKERGNVFKQEKEEKAKPSAPVSAAEMDSDEFNRQLDLFLKRADSDHAARKILKRHFRRGIYAVRPVHWIVMGITLPLILLLGVYATLVLNEIYQVNRITTEGVNLALEGRNEAAEERLEQALSYDLNRPAILYRFAQAFHLGDEDDRALPLVNELLDLQPNHIDGEILKASILFKRDEFKEARALLDEVLELDDRNRRALLLSGRVELARRNYGEAVTDFRTVLELSPRDVEAHHYLREVYLQQGDYEEAARQKNVLLTLDVSEVEHADLEVLVAMAQLFIEAGRMEEARLLLDRLVASQTVDPEVYYNLGMLTFRTGETQRAIEYLEQALAMRPAFPNALVLRGEIKYMDGDFLGAVEDFQKALRVDPAHARANYDMGNIFYYDYNDYGAALRYYLIAQSYDFETPYLNYNIGFSHYQRGDYLEALTAWEKVPDTFRDSRAYQWAVGNGLLLTGEAEEALARYNTVNHLEGGRSLAVLNNMGVANELLGKEMAAQEYYWQAVQLSADNPAEADAIAQENLRRSLGEGRPPQNLDAAVHKEIEKRLMEEE